MAKRFVSVGECMIELSGGENRQYRMGFAGDTLNAVWYARARLGADWQTDYQVVSLCTPVTWWIQGLRHGWYQYDQATRAWNRDRTEIPQQVLMYRMS